MTGTARKVRDVLRHGLLVQTALDALARVGIEIVPFRLYEESLAAHPDRVARDLPAGIELRPLTPADAPAAAAMPESDVAEAEARDRLRRGVLAVGAWAGDDLIACSWADLDELSYGPCRRPLAPDEAYLFGARTARSHRGMGLSPAVREALYERVAERGRRRLLSVSYSFHRPAIRFKEKLGARVRAKYVYLCLWSRWRRTWRWTGDP